MSKKNPGCLGAMLQAVGLLPKRQIDDALPYGVRDDFLSPAELSFYKVLQLVVRDRALACPKVSLMDIFFIKRSDRRQSYLNKISRKHVDFLLCSPDTLKPLAGIELDDSSHRKAARVERDQLVDAVFQAASLPLIRFKNQRSYVTEEVANKLSFLSVSEGRANFTEAPVVAGRGVPICPKCGVDMVLRTARQGANVGKSFYGCLNYPRCREVAEV